MIRLAVLTVLMVVARIMDELRAERWKVRGPDGRVILRINVFSQDARA